MFAKLKLTLLLCLCLIRKQPVGGRKEKQIISFIAGHLHSFHSSLSSSPLTVPLTCRSSLMQVKKSFVLALPKKKRRKEGREEGKEGKKQQAESSDERLFISSQRNILLLAIFHQENDRPSGGDISTAELSLEVLNVGKGGSYILHTHHNHHCNFAFNPQIAIFPTAAEGWNPK